MNVKKLLPIIFILILATFLRFYSLENTPPGLNTDEASQGYDAYSLLLTGKDQWGKEFPIFLRSFGSFQSSLYTYLTIIPTFLGGVSIFSTRFISALSGVLIVLFTYLIILNLKGLKSDNLAYLSALFVAISPWAIFFSRNATEANLALAIFLPAIYLFFLSIKNPILLPISFLLLGVSTYAYHAQRMIAFIFLVVSLPFFRKYLFEKWILVFLAILLFLIIQIPQFLLLNTAGANRRFDQVGYINQASGNFFEKGLFISRKFSAQFSAYLSPKNLFDDPDPQQVRSIPNLSVFYSFMIVPFLFGIREFVKKFSDKLIKILTLIGFISLIPAALTTEPFYTMRVLPYLWFITLVMSCGLYALLKLIPYHKMRILTLMVVFIFSLLQIYIYYFLFLKYERSEHYKFALIELAKLTEGMKDEKIIVDTSRDNQLYILLAFYQKYDPKKFQQINGLKDISNYYSEINLSKKHTISNIELREINWDDANKEQILVGDDVGISDYEVRIHNLSLLKEFKDLNGKTVLRAFRTQPKLD